MALVTFKLTPKRPVDLLGKTHPAGVPVFVIGAESEELAMAGFRLMGWSAWEAVRVDEPKAATKGGK